MKNRSRIRIHQLLLIGALLLLTISCKKTKEPTPQPTHIPQLPVLSTSAVINISAGTASCGGTITSDAGFTVSARGVCWSTGTTPVITDHKTNDGPGAGNFTSDITDLTLGTTYYVRAYATNSEGTGYGSTMSFTTLSTLAIGMNYKGGKVAYILWPGDPGYIAGEQHGLIASPNDLSMIAFWGCSGTLTSASETAIGTGFQNTVYIWSLCSEAGIAATLCYDFVSEGYSDWYLPSKDELFQLYNHQAQIGGFVRNIYWSSSEIDAGDAWCLFFLDGTYYNDWKTGQHFVRAVRAF